MTQTENLIALRNRAFARCALLEAADPEVSRSQSLHLFGRHTPITRDDVARRFGCDAAKAWDDVKIAIKNLEDAMK
jgi:hypothetical protein